MKSHHIFTPSNKRNMKTTKKLIQRSLSVTTTYKITGSYYSGAENGICCENCGKAISNIAEIESKEGKRYLVGMDCASTLSGIKGDFDFEYIHKANFTTAKSTRAALLKAQKEGHKNLNFSTFENTDNFYKQIGSGKYEFDRQRGGNFDGYAWKQFPADVWGNYVYPMIKDIKF